mmetsp:Transcript_42267/g.30449  ORF Transcript_42267/g.30449 Transcript_42267/m.30449 type:complete len:132 (-) Transcript_42267:123-518(-)
MNVISLCILRGFRVPDAALLIYPAGVTTLNRFTPSSLLAIDDSLLRADLLKVACSCYNIEERVDGDKDFLLSPIAIPDEILAKFPPTRFFASEADPLRDHSYSMSLRLKKQGIDTFMYMMKDHIHGFVNLD